MSARSLWALVALLLACNAADELGPARVQAMTCASLSQRLAVAPTALAVEVSGSGGVAATVTENCATDTVATGTVTWTSADTTIATVTGSDRTATVTGVGVGSTSVTATWRGTDTLTASVAVTVVAADTVPCTATSTHLCPGDDVAAKVTAAGAGASFTFGAGTYGQAEVVPLTGQTFTGGTGVVWDGGKTLTGFVSDGSGHWYVTGQTQPVKVWTSGTCDPSGDYPLCHQANQLWFDTTALKTPVASLAACGAGEWFFDDTADRIYVCDDPTGHVVETSVADAAIRGTSGVNTVTITGITFRHYAANGQGAGVIQVRGNGWTVTHDTVIDNSVAGIQVQGNLTSATITDNVFSRNAQYGYAISSGGSTSRVAGLVFARNHVDSNNTAGVNRGFGAGAGKAVRTDSIAFTGNRAYGNRGNGFWWDIDNRWVLADRDTAQANYGTGFFCEIGYGCTITNSIATGNGTDPSDAQQNGAGLLCSATSGCEFANNTVSGNAHGIILFQQDRGSGKYGPYLVQDANIHDNTVTMLVGRNGFVGSFQQSDFNFTRNNLFTDNTYHLKNDATKFFWSNGSSVTDAAWQALPQDATGTILRDQ